MLFYFGDNCFHYKIYIFRDKKKFIQSDFYLFGGIFIRKFYVRIIFFLELFILLILLDYRSTSELSSEQFREKFYYFVFIIEQ